MPEIRALGVFCGNLTFFPYRPEKYRLQALRLFGCSRNCPKISQKLIEKIPLLYALILLGCRDLQ